MTTNVWHHSFKVGDKVDHAGYVFEIKELVGESGIIIKHRYGSCHTCVQDVVRVSDTMPVYGFEYA